MTAAVLRWALGCLELQKVTVVATVIETSGSVPGKTGARIAMSDMGENWVGTIGGAAIGSVTQAKLGDHDGFQYIINIDIVISVIWKGESRSKADLDAGSGRLLHLKSPLYLL